MIDNLTSIYLSDLLVPLAELGPPLLLSELLKLLFYAFFFLLALVFADIGLNQFVDLLRILRLIGRGDGLRKIRTLAFDHSRVGGGCARASCCRGIWRHDALHLRSYVISDCLQALVVRSRLRMRVILAIRLDSGNHRCMGDSSRSVVFD